MCLYRNKSKDDVQVHTNRTELHTKPEDCFQRKKKNIKFLIRIEWNRLIINIGSFPSHAYKANPLNIMDCDAQKTGCTINELSLQFMHCEQVFICKPRNLVITCFWKFSDDKLNVKEMTVLKWRTLRKSQKYNDV